jgi:hypothetical protein
MPVSLTAIDIHEPRCDGSNPLDTLAADGDPATGSRELDAVRQQVEQDLPNTALVAGHLA